MLRPLIAMSFLLHAYIGWRLLPPLTAVSPVVVAVLAAWLLASVWLLPQGLRSRHANTAADRRLAWASLLAMGFFSSLFVLTLLRDVLLAASVSAQWAGWLQPSAASAALPARSALAVPLLALLTSAIGLRNARRTAGIKRVDVPIAGLAPALHGFTIAQLSDIHVGPTIRRPDVQAMVDAVNALGADVVAVTGDLVDGSVPALADHVAPLAGLRARHGSFVVTGNHEYYAGAHAWVDELRRIGLTVLMNEHVLLDHDAGTHGRGAVLLAGVTDYNAHQFDPSHRSDPVAALAGAPPGVLRVLLAHQPRSADAAAQAGFDLQLSGHTHGGQFLPWNFFVRLQQPFVAGLRRWGRMWVYTSRGTGYWGPPKRLGAPSEIGLLRLVPDTSLKGR